MIFNLLKICKKKPVPPVETVVLFDPMVPLTKIPVVEKSPIIRQISDSGKMAEHPDYKKYCEKS
jgi:hypothetical protein